MKKYICLIILTVFILTGCATIPRYWTMGSEGYSSPEGIAARAAVKTVAQPLVGEPWSVILSNLASLLIGGYAIYKRQKWLDTPTTKTNTS